MGEYQKIEFGPVNIEGKDRFPEYKLIFTEHPTDKSILDIGCNLGYYCFQAKFAGAGLCLGVDNHSAFIKTANRIKDELELQDLYFHTVDITHELNPNILYDIVLMLYVVHHFTDIGQIKKALKRGYNLAKEMIVFGVLNPESDKDFEWLTNSKGNKKMALSKKFFTDLFPKDRVESVTSAINDNRSIIKVYKEK
jgi:SAM-dependent methyltransferase